jgi:hypothetical protein
MTDGRVTQVSAEVLVEKDDPVVRVTSATTETLVAGHPDLLVSALEVEVATGSDAPRTRVTGVSAQAAVVSDAPRTRVSAVSVQVLVSWRVKSGFQAIWVD